nr:hypothetical protein [Prevotella sp.]
MARYIKANPLVARYLQLENDRNTLSDGNYLFWQNDMLEFGPLTQLNNTLAQIGGIALMPHEAREEQDGTVCRPLPMAIDARFQRPNKTNVDDGIVNEPTEEETEQGESEDNANSKDNGDEGQANEEDANSDLQPEASESEANEKSNE